jgi:hypothetical protein
VRFKLVASLMALAFVLPSTPASPQYWGSIDMSLPMMNSAFAVNAYSMNAQISAASDRNTSSGRDAGRSSDRAAPAPVSQTVGIVSPNRALVPQRLAQAYPVQRRQQVQDVFARLLANHGDLMARFNLPRDDLAGAMASYVAGAWMAYNNRPFPDAYFLPLVEQMRPIVGANTALADASPAQRREAFEEFAILGMMSAGTQMALAQNPDNPNAAAVAANMRAAGASYLRAATSMDPDRVRIGADGLSFAPAQ